MDCAAVEHRRAVLVPAVPRCEDATSPQRAAARMVANRSFGSISLSIYDSAPARIAGKICSSVWCEVRTTTCVRVARSMRTSICGVSTSHDDGTDRSRRTPRWRQASSVCSRTCLTHSRRWIGGALVAGLMTSQGILKPAVAVVMGQTVSAAMWTPLLSGIALMTLFRVLKPARPA